MIGLMAIIQFSYYATFNNGWMRQWYFNGWFIIFIFGVSLVCSQYLNFLFRFKNKISFKFFFIVIPSLIFVFLKASTYGCLNNIKHEKFCLSWKYFSEQSKILLSYKSTDFTLVGWTPDRATFFSNVGIIHLEGLVNSYDYINNYLPNKIDQYLKKIKATHFIISNKPYLPKKLQCQIPIFLNSEKDNYVYGRLLKRNSYIAIYKIYFTNSKINKNNLERLCLFSFKN